MQKDHTPPPWFSRVDARQHYPALRLRLPGPASYTALTSYIAGAGTSHPHPIGTLHRVASSARVGFGFPELYKVFVDLLFPSGDALRELLSARATPIFTSKCILADLMRLDKYHAVEPPSSSLT